MNVPLELPGERAGQSRPMAGRGASGSERAISGIAGLWLKHLEFSFTHGNVASEKPFVPPKEPRLISSLAATSTRERFCGGCVRRKPTDQGDVQ